LRRSLMQLSNGPGPAEIYFPRDPGSESIAVAKTGALEYTLASAVFLIIDGILRERK